jgi:F0F1-type ATP synthase membrane subunit b/b'
MLERDGIVEAAHARADQIIDEIRGENDRTKREADEYVLNSLTSLENELDRLLGQVRNGIRTLQSENQNAAAIPERQTREIKQQ